MTALTRRRGEQGQTMLESALVLIPFLLLIFGSIEFGAALFAANFVSYAAGEGARYAIVHGSASPSPATATAVSAYVKGLAVGIPGANALTVTTTWPTDNKPGSLVKVKVQYNYQPMTMLAFQNAIPLHAESQMVIRQ